MYDGDVAILDVRGGFIRPELTVATTGVFKLDVPEEPVPASGCATGMAIRFESGHIHAAAAELPQNLCAHRPDADHCYFQVRLPGGQPSLRNSGVCNPAQQQQYGDVSREPQLVP